MNNMAFKQTAFLTIFLCIFGCVEDEIPARASSTWQPAPEVQLLETEFDIFNLRWGCSKEFVEKNCDFGGKPAAKIVSGLSYRVDFSKTSVAANFEYNSRNELCSVDMMHFYPDKEFASAVDFFFYLNSILQQTYPDKNNPNAQSNRYTLNGYFKYMHLPAAVRFEYFMRGRFYLMSAYETKSSKIHLSVIPWSRPNSLETLPVLVLSYKSKRIRSDIKSGQDSKVLDSKGL